MDACYYWLIIFRLKVKFKFIS